MQHNPSKLSCRSQYRHHWDIQRTSLNATRFLKTINFRLSYQRKKTLSHFYESESMFTFSSAILTRLEWINENAFIRCFCLHVFIYSKSKSFRHFKRIDVIWFFIFFFSYCGFYFIYTFWYIVFNFYVLNKESFWVIFWYLFCSLLFLCSFQLAFLYPIFPTSTLFSISCHH